MISCTNRQHSSTYRISQNRFYFGGPHPRDKCFFDQDIRQFSHKKNLIWFSIMVSGKVTFTYASCCSKIHDFHQNRGYAVVVTLLNLYQRMANCVSADSNKSFLGCRNSSSAIVNFFKLPANKVVFLHVSRYR